MTRERRIIAGVCATVADRWGIDVTLLRLAMLLLTLAWGIGFIVYIVAWVWLPSAIEPRTSNRRGVSSQRFAFVLQESRDCLQELAQAWSRRGPIQAWPRPLTRRWLGLAMIALGSLMLLASLGALSWLSPLRALGLAAVAGGSALVMSLH